MSQIAPAFWETLAASRPAGDAWHVRSPFPIACPRLLASLAANGDRRFLVALQAHEDQLEDMRSRGLAIRTFDLADEAGVRGRFLAFECRDSGGHDVFDIIGEELANAINLLPPAEAAARVLAKWRRFWGQVPRSLLARAEQIGLFAEVWFLSRWLIPAAGTTSVSRWRGPFGSRHDFEWPGRSVEVKATTVVRGPVFHINGLDQLEPPQSGELFLFGLRMREEASASHSLPGLIKDCRAQLEADGDALGRYETALIQAGYSPAHDIDYEQVHWRVYSDQLYAVSAEFPRLCRASFLDGVPSEVGEISYSLDLSSYAGPCVPNPFKAVGLLK